MGNGQGCSLAPQYPDGFYHTLENQGWSNKAAGKERDFISLWFLFVLFFVLPFTDISVEVLSKSTI